MNGIDTLIGKKAAMISLLVMSGYNSKMATCKPRIGISPDTGTLFLDFPAS